MTAPPPSADDLLLAAIRAGDPNAWARLVEKFQGRLVAFARGQTAPGSGAGAEDAVQDVFFKFLRGLDGYRGEASLETWLFGMLRTRLIDLSRRHAARPCLLGGEAVGGWLAPQPTASAHAAFAEQAAADEQALAGALRAECERHRSAEDFAKLRALELLFFAQLPAPQVAARSGLSAEAVARLKHRTVQRVAAAVQAKAAAAASASANAATAPPPAAGTLAAAWVAGRPSCPKRSTLGSWALGSLGPAWAAFLSFHLDELGCRACRANRDDLAREVALRETRASPDPLTERILASSIGFWQSG